MVWSSVLVMTGIDLAIILVAVYVWVLLLRYRHSVRTLGLVASMYIMLAGLGFIACFHLVDLYLMHIQPSLNSTESAMAWMTVLHLTWSRIAMPLGIAVIGVGLVFLIKRLIPSPVKMLGSLNAAERGLSSELAARQQVEASLRKSNDELEARVAERADELFVVSKRLQDEITERRRSEDSLRSSEERFRVLYHENPSMFFTVDSAGSLLSVNQFGADVLGYAVEELIGTSVAEIFRREDRELFHSCLANCFEEPGVVHQAEIQASDRRGCSLWLKMIGRVIVDRSGQSVGLIVCDNVTDLHQLSQRLSHQASHDVLTGLVNRREFERRLGRILSAAQQETGEYAVCYLDLDKFKYVNDSCGHAAGDELLRQLGNVLRKRIRKRDTVARLGGDEFAVLLEHCAPIQARRFADELCQAIGDFQFVWEGQEFSIGVSIGLVSLTSESKTLDQVMGDADKACYMAKEKGRNRVYVAGTLPRTHNVQHDADRWYARLQQALKQDEFRLYHQPIFPMRLNDQPRQHYEVLLRMVDASGSILPPGVFIRSVERLGLAPAVDRWVVSHVLEWLALHPERLDALYIASINLSGISLSDDDFLGFLRGQLTTYRHLAEKICFEVTETAAISTPERTARYMGALRDLGCHFALDDFGSGASSFECLKRLPVDFIKIDGIFVRNIARDSVDYLMVNSFHEIAETMGKQTIAECVENQDIYEKLFEIGITYVQGFGLAEPRPLCGDQEIEPVAALAAG